MDGADAYIKGEAFVVGSDGERTGVESVVGAAVSLPSTDGLQEPDQESTASSRSAWIVINIGALALVAAAVVLRRLLKNPRP